MRPYALLSVLGGLAGSALWLMLRPQPVVQAAGDAVDRKDPVPVVVELFTSEGCSSCPPADEVLARLEKAQPVPGARVVPLAFHVDYWDELGWPDSFASPAFTARQGMYATAGGRSYTPQAVVDGRTELVGSQAAALERAIAQAAFEPHASVQVVTARATPSVEATVHVGALPGKTNGAAQGAEVFVAVVQDRASVRVARGENAGRTLDHTSIVRGLEAAGTVGPGGGDVRATLRLPVGLSGTELHVVAFAQRTGDHRIVGSSMRSLSP